jgi:hypothetical protein
MTFTAGLFKLSRTFSNLLCFTAALYHKLFKTNGTYLPNTYFTPVSRHLLRNHI